MNRLRLARSKPSCTLYQQGMAAMFPLPVCVVTDLQVVRCLTFL